MRWYKQNCEMVWYEKREIGQEEREATELEVALHRARALLGEKEIRLRHIERALRTLTDSHPPPYIQVPSLRPLSITFTLCIYVIKLRFPFCMTLCFASINLDTGHII